MPEDGRNQVGPMTECIGAYTTIIGDTDMPELPSGLKLIINRSALFDHGGNWFKCPPGHFWYWVPNEKINPPPFRTDRDEILQSAEYAPVPRNPEEVKRARTHPPAHRTPDLRLPCKPAGLDQS